MSGSWLGRGRVGRLVLLAGATITILFALFLYHSANNEMARLRDLHVKCAQQQEALAAQLQVLYEYKVQLEKTLSNEKSTNQAVKEELQQKASRERERDKNSREALQRYNSLQQNYKLLQTEHQDLKDDCKKKEDVALKNAKNLEETLQELRIELKKAADDKKRAEDERKSFSEERKTFSEQKKAIDEERKSIEAERKSFEAERKTYEEERKEEKKTFEHMKTKYMVIVEEKEQLEENYNSLKKTLGTDNGNVERLQKQVVQLQRELDESRKSPHFSIGSVKPAGLPSGARQMIPRRVKEPGLSDNNVDNNNNNDDNKLPGLEANPMQMMRPSSQQQVSRPSDELQAAGQNPQPLQAPQNDRHPVDEANASNNNNLIDIDGHNDRNNNHNNNNKNEDVDSLPNELQSDVRFENRNGNIVPVGPNDDVKDQQPPPQAFLPMPYQQPLKPDAQVPAKVYESGQDDAEQSKQVLVAPPNNNDEGNKHAQEPQKGLSSKGPIMVPILKPQAVGQPLSDSEQNAIGDPNDFD